MSTKTMDFIGWGLILWFFGYILGLAAFFIVSVENIGWVVGPPMLVATAWVADKRVYRYALPAVVLIGITWTILAVVLDYLMIVKLLNPPDGYYKADVYLYYGLTLLIPPAVWVLRSPKVGSPKG